MGIVSLNDLDRLFWAGRYCERAVSLYERFTSLPSFDLSRNDFAVKMGITCDIVPVYVAFFGDDGAVTSAVRGWCDNVTYLRQILGSRAVMLAGRALDEALSGMFDMLPLKGYAFFGMASDRLTDDTARACIEAGRMCEKLDIMSRCGEEVFLLEDALSRLITATKESAAVENMISRCAATLIREDLSLKNVAAVSGRTAFLESNNEYS